MAAVRNQVRSCATPTASQLHVKLHLLLHVHKLNMETTEQKKNTADGFGLLLRPLSRILLPSLNAESPFWLMWPALTCHFVQRMRSDVYNKNGKEV